ncbi:hypothetical protein A3D77_06300 [Candidatus Gottesmanbacteria bacterium RIFCSPHIGHO2_02_FULL_39_11]|uniref:YbaK/aminoacyl-tRNA synthetase-associated domain-containing protein n=1 Tax=Candidatus Gottesmanbacteria bacterium RIFCSPHIGHO2_02_FULL_39_11 TaxID=1798382 RepID=A0A1F5ZVT1_9BACT|nr:MAG: hypothetical protein A3D77_06300 [Candidatus Gottesmanbacteria bacterium RIFCSPHIGHO2_02_FULL_39_11]
MISLLKENNFRYESFEHAPVRTSIEAAKIRTGYTLSQGTKALIVRVKADGKKFLVMLVIPGDKKFDSEKVRTLLHSKDIRFATEEEVIKITDGVLPGGVPPFGNLFNIPVYIDPKVLENEKIIFNAGDRSFSIAMKSEDYFTLVRPIVSPLTSEG